MNSNKANLLASTLFAGVAAVLTPGQAAAQQQPAQPAPAAAPADDQQQEEDVVVTGTIIRGNANSTNPLSVLSADDMAQRGETTIADTLETLSGNAGGSLPNSFTANGAFASGASAVSLRGLLTSNTLVLFDGMRSSYYPLADDATRNFVDLNTIPQAIVDRVEVLKDGASSTYGADAIAGVINVITRREYSGFQLNVDSGWRQDGDGAGQQHISALWGHGDLARDGFNIYVSAEYQHNDIFYARDADYFPATTADISSICGTSLTPGGPGTVGSQTCATNGNIWDTQFDGSFLAPTTRGFGSTTAMIRRRDAANTGFDGDYQLLDTSCNAHDRPGVITSAAAAINGVSGFSSDVNVCSLDPVHEYGVIMPEDTRFSLSARASFRLGDGWEAYLMGNYYQNETFNTGAPSNIRARMTPSTTGVIFRTDTGPNLANLPVYVCPSGSYTHVCTAGDPGAVLNPNNPFAAAGREAGIWYSFGDIEASNRNFAQAYRGAGDLTGDFTAMGHDFNFDLGFTAMQTDLTRTANGALYFPNLEAAIRQGTYNFVNPDLNSQAIRDFISPESVQRSNSRLVQVQASASTDLFELPGGAAQLGVSLAARYESLDNPSANSDRLGAANRYFVINPFGASGERNVESVAFELDMPVISTLDVNVSGRYDTYSTGQSNFSPKIGARFEPFDWLAFRGTYSQGFRIPSFAESFADPSTGFTVVNAPVAWCAANQGSDASYCNGYALGLTSIASPDLQPETSENFNLGVVLRPFDHWTFSADYYKITQDGVIGAADFTGALANYYSGGPAVPGITIIPDAPNPAFPLAQPRAAFVQFGLDNLGTRETHGWDFQVSGSYDLGPVQWTTTADATWLQALNQEFPGGGVQEFAGTIGPYAITAASGTPKWRLNWQNTFEWGPAALTLTAYWTEGYLSVAEDNGGSHTDRSCLSGVGSGTPATYLDGTTPIVCKVDDSFYIDAHASYDITDNVQLYLNVSNLLGEDPAFDPTTYGAASPSYNPAWGTPGILGRFFTIGARATF